MTGASESAYTSISSRHLQQSGRFAHQSVHRRSLAVGVAPCGVVHERGVQRGEQGAQIVGLDQVVAGTGADRLHRQAHVAVAGEHHHRWSQRRGSDAAQQFQAAAVGQHEVQEHDIHVTAGDDPFALGQRGGGQQLVLLWQHQVEGVVSTWVVIDEQQPNHGPGTLYGRPTVGKCALRRFEGARALGKFSAGLLTAGRSCCAGGRSPATAPPLPGLRPRPCPPAARPPAGRRRESRRSETVPVRPRRSRLPAPPHSALRGSAATADPPPAPPSAAPHPEKNTNSSAAGVRWSRYCRSFSGGPMDGATAPLCCTAWRAIRCQRACLRAAASGWRRPWVRAATTGTMAATPSSVAWRTIRSISPPLGSAWISVSRQAGRGAAGRRLARSDAEAQGTVRHPGHGGPVTRAGAVDHGEGTAGSQPAHPDQVVVVGAGQLHLDAGARVGQEELKHRGKQHAAPQAPAAQLMAGSGGGGRSKELRRVVRGYQSLPQQPYRLLQDQVVGQVVHRRSRHAAYHLVAHQPAQQPT